MTPKPCVWQRPFWGDRGVAITLAPISSAAITHDRDVTELKGMFGEAEKVVLIEDMNAAIGARGSSAD